MRSSIILALVLIVAAPVVAAENEAPKWLDFSLASAVEANETVAVEETQAPAAGKPAPLPFHTIEGVGGVAITPTAYLVNPGPAGTKVGLPSASFTYVNLGQKSIQSFAVTQTFFGRVELGYAANRFDLGTLSDAVRKATGGHMREDVYLHHFNVRALLLEENSFDLPLPAITAGVHFKINDGINAIDDELGGAISGLGFSRSNGTDFTLTASKTIPNVLFGRPFIVSVGMRNSQASQIGYLGFSDHCATTVEGNVICLVTDQLAVAYEFRGKTNPYNRLNNLIGDEDNWHTIALGYVFNEHFTISGGYGHFGNVFNSEEDGGLAIQLKYEF